jgi:hypothetical protein
LVVFAARNEEALCGMPLDTLDIPAEAYTKNERLSKLGNESMNQ